ncbi:MAG: TolC family protein [Bacteroidales bacterium]|nr:TolC family protein [Bacteroidales bacterium]
MKTSTSTRKLTLLALLMAMVLPLGAQQVLSLQECREMALENNNKLKIAQEKVNVADYDKKIAVSNYFPKITAQGAYMYNDMQIKLIGDSQMNAINNMGTTLQNQVTGAMTPIIQQIMQDPALVQLIMNSPALQSIFQGLQAADFSAALNAIGQEVTNALTLDTRNVYAGMISVQEPVYAGGKIRAYNKMARYGKDLAQSQFDTEQQEIIVNTDKAYWQIVSLANKLKLTQSYLELLQTMSNNVDKLVEEGMATSADRLAIKVKLNDAELSMIRVQNGLALSKMLLCQSCGLPLDSNIALEDENLEDVAIPVYNTEYTEEDIMNNRPELQSLDIATKIYDKKVKIARSDFLPMVAVAGNYIVTNPSVNNGFQNEFHGFFNVGVVAKVPLFHFCEGYYKVRKAKSEAMVMKLQLEDTKELIMLQVSQYEKQIHEAESRLQLTTEKMSDAEENLRMATLGFNEGMIPSSTLDMAQTSWMQAHSEMIDAKIDVIMANTYLKKSIGKLE